MNKLIARKASTLRETNSNDLWHVEGLIPAHSFVLMTAAPKIGKTQTALAISIALASGQPALGEFRVTRQRRVVYFAGEDTEAILAARISAITKDMELDPSSLDLQVVCGQRLRIDTLEGQAALEQLLIDSGPTGMLVLDNLACIHASCESDAKQMSRICEYLHDLKKRHNCTVLVVHHLSKNGSIRGSSVLSAQFEAAISLRRDRTNWIEMSLTFRAFPSQEGIPLSISGKGNQLSVRVIPKPERQEPYEPCLVWIGPNTIMRVA